MPEVENIERNKALMGHEEGCHDNCQHHKYYLANKEQILRRSHERYLAKRTEILEYTKKYRESHREKTRILAKNWLAKNKERHREYVRRTLPIRRERDRKRRFALKVETMLAYGGECVCCGESNIEFLTIDHVNGDGRQHKKELKAIGLNGGQGNPVYVWLKRNGYPREGYRVLCMNCNTSRGFYGYCPHEEKPVG